MHRAVYFVLVTLLGGCMVCSTWAANLMWVLLGANWVLEGRWREKWQMARASRLLQAYLLFYVLLMAGMLWTENMGAGWSLLQVKLPLLVVPLVMLTTRPLTGRQRTVTLVGYVGTVLVVSFISAVRMVTMPELPYREAVPYISHIRFALNCCLAIFILVAAGVKPVRTWPVVACRWVFALWLLVFLLLIHSYTAMAVLLAVSSVLLVRAVVRSPRRWPVLMVWVLAVGGAVALVAHEVHGYYDMVPMAKQPLKEYTAGGRPYEHACDGAVENGNYINNYICREELRAEWQRRSALPYDSLTAGGYNVESTLLRYLNAKGLTKDSVGMTAMSETDIDAVERGVANPVYESNNLLRKMVYVMLLEREYYIHTRAVSGFTMLQRFELWRATWHVVREHPWIGVGTGDAVDAMHAELVSMDSELAGTTKKSHNEYLSLLLMLGFVGMSIIVVMFLRSLVVRHSTGNTQRSVLMLAWTLTILISFLTEDTLDTLAGILFCTWFLAVRQAQRSTSNT